MKRILCFFGFHKWKPAEIGLRTVAAIECSWCGVVHF